MDGKAALQGGKFVRAVVSCFECVMLHHCHRALDLTRDGARASAGRCRHPARGRTTDVIRVFGQASGISRKKAVRLATMGRLRWLDASTVALDEAVPVKKS
jgi:hypothetical protein